jgi:putative PIN family toxin of toxin-antitoxin system
LESEIYVSSELLKEYREVPIALKDEGKINHKQLKSLISGIATVVAKAKLINPVKKFTICRDNEDNMVIDCCFASGANLLITGDKDLLDINELPFKLKILTSREFVEKE